MSDFSVEKKLELVQQVRSKYYQNQSDMMNREQILYGRSEKENEEEGIFKDGTLKLRYALAAVLAATIILFDRSGQSLGGISMEEIFTAIETDYEKAIEAWIAVSNSDTKIIPPLE